MVLGPDSFRIPEPGESSVPPAVSPEWRMTVQARQTWQDTLKARIDQQQALKQALRSVVDATEEDTLPLLRDALVSAIGNLQSLPDAADALTQKLLIDVTSSGFQTITRIAQAIQTLQGILIALRTGRLEVAWEQDTAKEPQADFDEELEWIGSYGTWHAAMQVFLFPENFLLPTLRPVPDVLPSVPEKGGADPRVPTTDQGPTNLLGTDPRTGPDSGPELLERVVRRLWTQTRRQKLSAGIPSLQTLPDHRAIHQE